MQIGVIFPQTEIGPDPAGVRAYAQAVQDLGFRHLEVFDHVLGADPARHPGWEGVYDVNSQFHEPFVVFGFLAAVAPRLELVTSVIVLGQRQTALVAKQAAEVDVLSGGKLRLGVGVGWNEFEYQGLNESFHNRGARCDEQIAVLRALWTQPVVTFHGRWHHIEEAGIKPLPVQQPIPIWIGGHSEAALKRAGRLGNGWLPQRPPDDEMRAQVERVRGYAQAAGRDPGKIGIEARLNIKDMPEAQWAKFAEAWRNLGATYLCVNTMGAGFQSLQQHIDALRRAKESLGDI